MGNVQSRPIRRDREGVSGGQGLGERRRTHGLGGQGFFFLDYDDSEIAV